MEKSSVESINEVYDPIMVGERTSIYEVDKIGFYNIGYWRGVEDSVELAQINLIETLSSFLSKKSGNVLDVACGKGASSQFLTKYFAPGNITGINISEIQLQICKMLAPGCNFRLMDATSLDFDDSSFDNVLCIESAYHFVTRAEFFREAYRVLKHDGRLALEDIVVHDYAALLPTMPRNAWPEENCLPTVAAYGEALGEAGFRHVRVEDTTQFAVASWLKFRIRKAERESDYETLERLKLWDQVINTRSRGFSWCMAYAIK